MGTTSSFFGGGGGAAAIPNVSYDPIRKATYKSVLSISQNQNFKMVPMSDTTFATFSGSNTNTLYGGHYTINEDGSLTENQAPTSLGVTGAPFAGCATADYVLLHRTTTSSGDGCLDKIAWNGTALSLTNIRISANPWNFHCAGSSLYNGYLIAVCAGQSDTTLQAAMIRPDGTTQSTSFTNAMKYGQTNQVHYTGASDGVHAFGRSSSGQSSSYYGVGYQCVSPGQTDVSGNFVMSLSSDLLDTGSNTFDQISSVSSWPGRTSGAHFFGVDGNSRFGRGAGGRKGLSIEFSQSPATSPTTSGETSFASASLTNSGYGHWRQYNGTVTDGKDNSLVLISNEGMGSFPVPSALTRLGLRNVDSKTPSDALIKNTQVGKYLVASCEANGTNNVVLNVYEVE
jgi:hypothetical protein